MHRRGDDSPPAGGDGASGSAQAFDRDRQAPAEPIEGTVAGGTVTLLTSNGFQNTDAFGADGADPTESYAWAAFMSAYVTRSLTQFVYDPAQDAMVVGPDIATDIGRPNADFTSGRSRSATGCGSRTAPR